MTLHNLRSVFPWEGDDWLMARLIVIGCRGNDLRTLNRVRKHQQVLFLSKILGARGKSLDKHYLQKQWGTEHWSTMKFPREVVTEVEMHLWRTAITQVVAAGPACNRLSTFNEEGHKIWDWMIREDAGLPFTGTTGTPLRICGMFDKDNMVHLVRVGQCE
jgi:hypothetical protein